MIIFSSLSAALREGYRWSEYLQHEQLHRVERDVRRPDGKRVKMLAFAKPQPEDFSQN
ncbi:hypothetical protein JST97_35200 [bacterium]|nr:hypothetical protein [bacterium]